MGPNPPRYSVEVMVQVVSVYSQAQESSPTMTKKMKECNVAFNWSGNSFPFGFSCLEILSPETIE